MAFFSAYFDESDSPVASVVAGVVISVEQLPHFEREWKQLLEDEKIKCFHMNEFAHFNGEFKNGWRGDDTRRANCLKRIIGIIARRCNISVGMVIDRAGYQRAIAQSSTMAGFYVNEYTAAGFMSLMLTGSWADQYGHDNPISYVFDDCNAKRADFDRAFHTAKSIPDLRSRYRLRGLTFEDDCEIVPLQAADFIAYEMCKAYTDINNDQKRFRRSMASLLRNVPGDWRIGSEEMLTNLAKEANAL